MRVAAAVEIPLPSLPPATADGGSRARRPASGFSGPHRPAENKRAPVNASKIHTLIGRTPMVGADSRWTSKTTATTSLGSGRSEEHTSELQSHHDLVCRLL